MKSTTRKSLPADLWKFQELADDSQLNRVPRTSVGFVVKKLGKMVTSADLETLAGPRATAEGLRAALGYTSAREQVGMSDSAQLAVLLNRMNKALRKSLPFEDHPNNSFPVRDERYRSPDGTINDHQSEHTARAASDLRTKEGDEAADEYLDDIAGQKTNDAQKKYKNDKVQPGTKAASAADADDCDHPGGDLDSYVLPSARARGYNPRTKQVDPDLVGMDEREYTERFFGDKIADAIHGPKEGEKDRGEYRVTQRGKMKIGDFENSADDNEEKTGGDGELSDEVKQRGTWPGGATSSPPPPEESGKPPSRAEEQEGGPPDGIVPSENDPTPDRPFSAESAERDPLAEARHSPDGTKVSDPAKFKAFITNARKYLRSQGIGTKVINKAASMEIARGLLAGKKGGGFGSKSMGMIHEQAQKEAANAGVRNSKHQSGDPLQGLSPKKLTKYYAMAIRSIFGAHKEGMKSSRSRATVMSAPSETAPSEPPKDAGTVAKETQQLLDPSGSAPETKVSDDRLANSVKLLEDLQPDIEDGMWSDGSNTVDLSPFLQADGRLKPGYFLRMGSDNTPTIYKSFRKSAPDAMSIDRVTSDPDNAPGSNRGAWSSSQEHGEQRTGFLSLDQPAFKRDQNLSNGSAVIDNAGLQREQQNILNDRPDGKLMPGIPNDPSAPKDEPWLNVNPETGEWEGKLTRFKLGALSFPVRAAYHIASQGFRGLTGINSDNVLSNLGDAAKLAFHGARQLAVDPEADPTAHNGTSVTLKAPNNVHNPYADTVQGAHMFGPDHDMSFDELLAAANSSEDPTNPHVRSLHEHLKGHPITSEAYQAYINSDGSNSVVKSNYLKALQELTEHHRSSTSARAAAAVQQATVRTLDPTVADGSGATPPADPDPDDAQAAVVAPSPSDSGGGGSGSAGLSPSAAAALRGSSFNQQQADDFSDGIQRAREGAAAPRDGSVERREKRDAGRIERAATSVAPQNEPPPDSIGGERFGAVMSILNDPESKESFWAHVPEEFKELDLKEQVEQLQYVLGIRSIDKVFQDREEALYNARTNDPEAGLEIRNKIQEDFIRNLQRVMLRGLAQKQLAPETAADSAPSASLAEPVSRERRIVSLPLRERSRTARPEQPPSRVAAALRGMSSDQGGGAAFGNALQEAETRASTTTGSQRVRQAAARDAELERLTQQREVRGRSRPPVAVQAEEQPDSQTIERPARARAQPIERTKEDVDETLRQIESMLRRKDSVQHISRTLGIKADLLNRVIAESGWSGLLPKSARKLPQGINQYRRSYDQDESQYGSLLKSVYNSL